MCAPVCLSVCLSATRTQIADHILGLPIEGLPRPYNPKTDIHYAEHVDAILANVFDNFIVFGEDGSFDFGQLRDATTGPFPVVNTM